MVCIGNICCLFIGECLLCKCLLGVKVKLVGVYGLVKYFVDVIVVDVVVNYGVFFEGYVGCKFIVEMVWNYDLILVMELEYIV